jgi:ATP-dependent protease HslVU (ClpYQ) peptidase subunit
MTTIVCNRVMMACDTQVSDDGIKSYLKTKIIRVNGDIIGTAGDYSEGLKFINWYQTKSSDKPETSDEWGALVLTNDGKIIQWDSGFYPIEISDEFYAIGTGAAAALAAMFCGKTPTEAAKIACKIDTHSGGSVRTLRRQHGSKTNKRQTLSRDD